MISYLFLVLASICNAAMDTLTHHYSISVFRFLDEAFWNPNVSWKFAHYLPYSKYKIDAWHLFKSAMIIFICLAIVFGNNLNFFDFLFLGLMWNLTFNLFYNKILKK